MIINILIWREFNEYNQAKLGKSSELIVFAGLLLVFLLSLVDLMFFSKNFFDYSNFLSTPSSGWLK